MNILYFGDGRSNATSFHRAEALRRIGCGVTFMDPYVELAEPTDATFWSRLHFHSGYRLLQPRAASWIGSVMRKHPRPDLIWVNGGELFGTRCLNILRTGNCPVVLYNNDNPTGTRDGARFDTLLKALPLYDLCAARSITANEMLQRGARRSMTIRMSYDEVAHAPFADLTQIPERLRSEVSFIGTWMRHEGRDRFLLELIRAGIAVKIWGERWQNSRIWGEIRPFWNGGALSGRDYVGALQGAKLCIGLLSRGNRDLHTRRSVETPYAGGLLCAERTIEHREMFRENEEAVFWSDADECIAHCRRLLSDDAEREQIRLQGMRRVRELHLGNEDICRRVLESARAGEVKPRRSGWYSPEAPRIIFIGNTAPRTTARQRAEALRRIGCEVKMLDPYADLGEHSGNPLRSRLHFHTGYRLLQGAAKKWIKGFLNEYSTPDLILVNGGELFGPECVKTLRSSGCPVVLYNNDDPTGGRDGARFDQLLKSLPIYDLCVAVRSITAAEMADRGARETLRVWMSYDEIAHAPFANPAEIPDQFRSEVAFIGTWMRHEKRDHFLLELAAAGIPVSIWGDRWQKSPVWHQIEPFWRGQALGGRDYVGAIQGAKVCLGMLSKGNRDLHTTRSLEVPYAGGVLCAERTSEHLELYREDVDALFWADAQECAEKCRWLLDHPVERESIRQSGMRRVREKKIGNEDVARSLVQKIKSLPDPLQSPLVVS